MLMSQKTNVIPAERIAAQIYIFRGHNVMLDSGLAQLYGTETKVLNQAVSRNIERFPIDFMFQLNSEEFENLKSHFVTSSWGGRRTPPRAFTEMGVSMLSSVLRSKQAIQVNIGIMRTFARLRYMLATNEELARKVNEHDQHIAVLYEELNKLLMPPEPPPKNPIGFRILKNDKQK